MSEAKRQAIKDMSESGISTSVLYYEKAIVEMTRQENSEKPDFHKFNKYNTNKKRRKIEQQNVK